MAEKAREEEVGMAPDPDEDDLDDLDGMLVAPIEPPP